MNLGDFFKEIPINDFFGLDADVIAESSEISSDIQVLTYASLEDDRVVNNLYPYCVFDNATANLIIHSWTELITLIVIEIVKAISYYIYRRYVQRKEKW